MQGTAPVTDFGYAGMFYNADSGLYLTQYRAYDPIAGRWLSHDPIGESSDPAGNLYPYANGNPVTLTDPGGRFGVAAAIVAGAVVGGATGALLDAIRQYNRNGGSFACFNGWELAGAVGAGAMLGATGGLIASEFFAAEETGTALSTYRYTQQGETFFHYGYESQAENFAGGLQPNGYATDVGNLIGEEAQSGLALPHAETPNAVYTVNPEPGTLVNVNPIVRPQFGQPGGQTEFQFPLGTGPGTVSGPKALP